MLPSTFATHLVLPTLLNSLTLTTMSTSAPSIIPLVIQLGTYVSTDDYQTLVLEPVVKLFANQDRGTRMALLDALPEFADKLDRQTVSEKVWPHLVSPPSSCVQRQTRIDMRGHSKLGSQTLSL
jgi:SCY1-like protein 1